MKAQIQNILVIQTAHAGDIIMSTPLFEGLRQLYPEAGIDVVVNHRHAGILANNPHIRKVLGLRKRGKKISNLFGLVRRIRRTPYDLALSMQIHMSSSLMMYLGGIRTRVGSSRQRLLTHRVAFPPGIHIREKAGMLLESLGKGPFYLQTKLYPSDGDRAHAQQYLLSNGRFRLGVAPGSDKLTRRWPADYFIKLLSALPDRVDVYLIGSDPCDAALSDDILKQSTGAGLINTTGKLSLLQSAALIDELDLLLCHDSPPLHVGNAMRTNVFAIFGPTVRDSGSYPFRDGDLLIETELPCRPCSRQDGRKCPEKHFRCMRDITPGRVLREIVTFIEGKRPGADPHGLVPAD